MTIQSLNGYAAQAPAPAPTPREAPVPVVAEAVAQPAAPEPQKSAQVTNKQVEQAVEKLKVVMQSKASALQFSVDDQSGDTIVRVVDSDTGEVIRQIPSKELVEIARALDKMQGMLLKQKA